jgi:hypothetical protein
MTRHGIPGCPEYGLFTDPDEAVRFIRDHPGELAVKPVGLTGGKGVRITGEQVDREGACAYVRELDGPVVVEERLEGEEFTLQAVVDGAHLAPMPLVQDHKRAFEGDIGPNTGGMGSYSMPDHGLPFVTNADREAALAIMAAVVRHGRRRSPFCSVLYSSSWARQPADGDQFTRFSDLSDEHPDPLDDLARWQIRGREPQRRLPRAGSPSASTSSPGLPRCAAIRADQDQDSGQPRLYYAGVGADGRSGPSGHARCFGDRGPPKRPRRSRASASQAQSISARYQHAGPARAALRAREAIR